MGGMLSSFVVVCPGPRKCQHKLATPATYLVGHEAPVRGEQGRNRLENPDAFAAAHGGEWNTGNDCIRASMPYPETISLSSHALSGAR